MADDVPPPPQYGSDVDNEAGRDDESGEEESGDESGDEQASDEDPDGGMPTLQSTSGSEAETEPATQKSNKNAPANSKPAAKPPIPPAATARQAAAKSTGEDHCLWTQFAKYRSGLTSMDRLGNVEQKQWEALAKQEVMPPAFLSWYADVIKGPRSVPHAVKVWKLPSGFPEFCHWVVDGHYKPSESPGALKSGFHPMAERAVKWVTAQAAAGGKTRTAAHRAAPASELNGAAGGVPNGAAGSNGTDPRSRKRERRMMRKGVSGGGNDKLAEKMMSALAVLEVEGIDDEEGQGGNGKSAANRAAKAGAMAEEEVRARMRLPADGPEDDVEGDPLGLSFDNSSLLGGTRAMLQGLRSARAYRRRADRQFELLEAELERSLSKLARVEAQYHALVAETSGRESSLEVALASALPMVQEATGHVDGGSVSQAVRTYSHAIKLLEVHVNQSPGEAESTELASARQTLGYALCNRSVANFKLGNLHSGKSDAGRAAASWSSEISRKQLERSNDYMARLDPLPPTEDWKAFPLPP